MQLAIKVSSRWTIQIKRGLRFGTSFECIYFFQTHLSKIYNDQDQSFKTSAHDSHAFPINSNTNSLKKDVGKNYVKAVQKAVSIPQLWEADLL